MKIYTSKKDVVSQKAIVADDMILTADMPTAAGSKMLDGYKSLFEAEVLTRLKSEGYELCGKTDVGEFAIDLVGETSYNGANVKDGVLLNPCVEALKSDNLKGAVCLDVNGSVRRAAAQNDMVSVKATYGTVSRYGTIPVACSGETVSVMAKSSKDCKDILDVIVGHDDKDGTSLSEELCDKVRLGEAKLLRVAVIADMEKGIDADVEERMSAFKSVLRSGGVEVVEINDEVIAASRAAWNVLMSAELCNNVSRYDGVKYGYRAQSFSGIDELYTNSRTQAFGELLKSAILFGSDTLSTENYMKVYDKALRVRRVVCERFAKIFDSFDAVLIPACSTMSYTESQIKENKYMSYEENFYTAPASISGLPAVVVGGVQLVGKAFSECTLLKAAELYEKEVK